MTEPNDPPAATPPGTDALATPVIVDMGRKKRKAIRRLRKGRGKALDEVVQIVEEVRGQLGERAAGTIILPVVVLYGNKRRRRNRWF